MPYSIINIRRLELFRPELLKGCLFSRVAHDDFPLREYFHFPLMLKPDRSPWKHGSLYLLSKLEAFNQPNPATLSSQANDLISFMNYLDSLQLDYLEIPKRKAARPTYQFRFYLQDLIKDGRIAESTAGRRMNAVINFYRWLSTQHYIKFQHDPWTERTAVINYETHFGLQRRKLVNTTDLSVRISPSNDTFSDHLSDGGKLKPLSEAEQISVLKALGELGNIEMTLIFLMAISTGARLQTICTLRLADLEINSPNDNEVRIIVGPGTLTDTKLSKRAVLYIPAWMFKKLKTYSQSPRANMRRQRNTAYGNSLDQYIFLTKGGQPYYIGKGDPSIGTVKRLPCGNAITQFIRSILLPKILDMGHQFEFRFHDLRATYGMNLVEINQEKLAKGEITYQKLKDFIRERMWHQSSDTTDAYLQYKSNHRFFLDVQDHYEQHLIDLMNTALNYG